MSFCQTYFSYTENQNTIISGDRDTETQGEKERERKRERKKEGQREGESERGG